MLWRLENRPLKWATTTKKDSYVLSFLLLVLQNKITVKLVAKYSIKLSIHYSKAVQTYRLSKMREWSTASSCEHSGKLLFHFSKLLNWALKSVHCGTMNSLNTLPQLRYLSNVTGVAKSWQFLDLGQFQYLVTFASSETATFQMLMKALCQAQKLKTKVTMKTLKDNH